VKAIIIPARSSSRRFPRKHLQRLGDTTVIGMLIRRALEVCEPVYVATTWLQEDSDLCAEAERNGARVWRGHPVDLLERFLELCLTEHIDRYMEISGDCPFFDQPQAKRIWDALDTPGYDIYTEEPSFAPNDTGVGGRGRSWLHRWCDVIESVPMERREQYWTAVKEVPSFATLTLPYHGDRCSTPIKISIDWPMDLAIANVILNVLGRPPRDWRDLETVWSAVHTLEVR